MTISVQLTYIFTWVDYQSGDITLILYNFYLFATYHTISVTDIRCICMFYCTLYILWTMCIRTLRLSNRKTTFKKKNSVDKQEHTKHIFNAEMFNIVANLRRYVKICKDKWYVLRENQLQFFQYNILLIRI